MPGHANFAYQFEQPAFVRARAIAIFLEGELPLLILSVYVLFTRQIGRRAVVVGN